MLNQVGPQLRTTIQLHLTSADAVILLCFIHSDYGVDVNMYEEVTTTNGKPNSQWTVPPVVNDNTK
jgi:hypothetical protein